MSIFKAKNRSSIRKFSLTSDINRDEVRAAKTMLIVIIAFTISWIPVAINTIFEYVSDRPSFPECASKKTNAELINNFCYWAIHLNCGMNPTIYALRIGDVRKTIKRLLGFKGYENQSSFKASKSGKSCSYREPKIILNLNK